MRGLGRATALLTGWAAPYGVAVLAVAAAAGFRWSLNPVLTGDYPMAPIMTVAVLVAAWVGGVGPGALAVVLGGIVLAVAFLPPIGSLALAGMDEAVLLASFVLVGVVGVAVCEAQHRLRRRAERATAAAREQAAQLREDVERRRATERALAEAVAQQRAVLASTLDPVVTIDSFGIIHAASDSIERVFGHRPEELVGRNVSVLMPEPHHSGHDGYLANYRRTGRTNILGRTREFEAVRRDGRRFPIELSVARADVPGQRFPMFTGIIRDITERKVAEQRVAEHAAALERSNQDLEQFAYVASHDLQEPLRMVGSFAQLLSRRYQGRLDAEADEFIHYIVDGARRMQSLIEDLLSYSRVSRKGREATATDAGRVVAEVLESLRPSIAAAGAEVRVGALPAVMADPSQLAQLFQNLVSNAVKFRSERAPEVSISAAPADGAAAPGGGEWVLSVADNGIGLEPQYQERVFAIFERLHGSEYPGTGIGLAICKKIVERHGGRIWYEPTPGGGATFKFTLRAAGREEAA